MFKKVRHKTRVLLSSLRENKKEKHRSPEWKKVRENFLKKNPTCAACGSSLNLQVHHKIPFHVNPLRELDESNLITLCMDEKECHLEVGHGDSWKCYNPKVEDDAKKLLACDSQHRDFLIESIKDRRLHLSNS